MTIPGTASLPAIEATLTTCPRPRATICGNTARAPLSGPRTFTSRIKSVVRSFSSMNPPSGMTPALLIKMSTGPDSARTWSRNAAQDSGLVTSRAPECALGMPFAVSLATASSTSPIHTSAPPSAKRRAVAAPIPLAPPVMTTTAPASSIFG
ncbi:Uncharacterised protein [Mycobacteroides abscessus subsp. abscessus]|nr:Uncharacterised protein [Mycobacteroides abscessus subsp. abscessus]